MTLLEIVTAVRDRFWSKVEKTPTCWLWTAAKTRTGYGRFQFEGKARLAHRMAYELIRGPIPSGLTLDHLCRVRSCVNPAHLEAVPLRVNLLRGMSFVADNARKTTCPKGHPYEGANLYERSSRRNRRCRACGREWMRDDRARRRAA